MNLAKLCKIVIQLIWILSVFSRVYFDIFRTVTNNGETFCVLHWSPKSRAKYFVIIFICLMSVIACVVTLLYLRIIHNLNKNRAAQC